MSINTWTVTSHCSWQFGWWSIVQLYCPRAGGVVFRLARLGRNVDDFPSLEAAQARVQSLEVEA